MRNLPCSDTIDIQENDIVWCEFVIAWVSKIEEYVTNTHWQASVEFVKITHKVQINKKWAKNLIT